MSVLKEIQLSDITTSHNPRRPCQTLQDALVAEGYEGHTMIDLIQKLALSPEVEKRAEFCRLIETYEGETVSDGIVNLANSRANTEIQPILLRDFRAKIKGSDEYVTRYGIVAGERRCIAAAYNYAKHGLTPEIGALVKKLTVQEAYNLAVEENAQRRPMSDLEYGRIFSGYRQEINPATGNKWSLKEIAAKLHLDYQFVRGREALVFLPENEQSRVDSGKTSVTKAIEKGLRIKQGKKNDEIIEDKKKVRSRTLSIKEVQKLFDEKRLSNHLDWDSPEKEAYLKALAEVMQITYATAVKESKARYEAVEKEEELAAAQKAMNHVA